jgi:hypothetical protein
MGPGPPGPDNFPGNNFSCNAASAADDTPPGKSLLRRSSAGGVDGESPCRTIHILRPRSLHHSF